MLNAVILGTAHPHIFGLAGSLKKIPDAQLVGVWDDNAEQLAAAAAKVGAPAVASLDEILSSGATLALIGAVPCDRAQLAARAVAAGMGVVVDKPIALTHEALDQLIAAVQKHSRPIMTYYPYRGHPLVLAARAALQAGRIGKLARVFAMGPHKLNPGIRPDWHWTQQHNGGCLIDIGAHHVDLCCWLADQKPDWITARHHNFTQPQHPGFQDFAQATMQFPDGCFGQVEVDWLNPAAMKNFGDTRIWLQGTEGKIEIRLGDEVRGEIWDAKASAEPLDTSAFKDYDFDRNLFQTTAAGAQTPMTQEEIWLSTRVALKAFDSAEQQGMAVRL